MQVKMLSMGKGHICHKHDEHEIIIVTSVGTSICHTVTNNSIIITHAIYTA